MRLASEASERFIVLHWSRAFMLCLGLAAAGGLESGCSTTSPVPPTPSPLQNAPQIKHVFTIILENQAYSTTFGPVMPVPYLSNTAVAQGALLQNYYGTSHFSNGNYISLVSGQAVTTASQDDCTLYVSNSGAAFGSKYVDMTVTSIAPFGQVAGTGCIRPQSTLTVADQLTAAGFTWKGYMEDMGNDPTREAATCGQPGAGIGAADNTTTEQIPPLVTDRYAARHNPFVYFHSLLDSGACAKHVVPLDANTLPVDLASIETTPNYVFITPNLCDDGHDVPCMAPNSPKTYVDENTFLQTWVPIIVRSPAFQNDGLLIITFDESSPSPLGSTVQTVYDGTACCNEPSGPNTQLPGSPPLGPGSAQTFTGSLGNSGGGETGSVLLSPFIKPGTISTVPYNHYYTLHAIESYFGLSYLGYAGYPGTTGFGSDVFAAPGTKYWITL
jgi:hypothetical protein